MARGVGVGVVQAGETRAAAAATTPGAAHALPPPTTLQHRVCHARVRHRAVPRCGRLLVPAPSARGAGHVPRPHRRPPQRGWRAELAVGGVCSVRARGQLRVQASAPGDMPAHTVPRSPPPDPTLRLPAGRGCAARGHCHTLHPLPPAARGVCPGLAGGFPSSACPASCTDAARLCVCARNPPLPRRHLCSCTKPSLPWGWRLEMRGRWAGCCPLSSGGSRCPRASWRPSGELNAGG